MLMDIVFMICYTNKFCVAFFLSIGVLLGALFSTFFITQIERVLPVATTLVGIFVGTGIARYLALADKKSAYVQNANNVLLIAAKQFNEFENIKEDFDKLKDDKERHIKTQGDIVSETEWRLSKSEVLGLNNNDKDMLNIMYDLISLDKSFKDLLLAISDFNSYREPIVMRFQKGSSQISQIENDELQRYLDAVYRRIDSLDFKSLINKLSDHLKRKFPDEEFITVSS